MDEPEIKVTDGAVWIVFYPQGVSIRLIAAQDVTTKRWRLRPPAGVMFKPQVWSELANKAMYKFLKNVHPEELASRRVREAQRHT